MALATKCPHCNTIFRVAHDQLKLRGGIVRCGSCNEVFDGNAALVVPQAAPAEPQASPLPPAAPLEDKLAALDTRATALHDAPHDTIYTLELDAADTAGTPDADTGARRLDASTDAGAMPQATPAVDHAAAAFDTATTELPAPAAAAPESTPPASDADALDFDLDLDLDLSVDDEPAARSTAPRDSPFSTTPAELLPDPAPAAASTPEPELDLELDVESMTDAELEAALAAELAAIAATEAELAQDAAAELELAAAAAQEAAAEPHFAFEPAAAAAEPIFDLEPLLPDDGRREPTLEQPPAAADATGSEPFYDDLLDDDDAALVQLSSGAQAQVARDAGSSALPAHADASPDTPATAPALAAAAALASASASAADDSSPPDEPGFVKRDRRQQKLRKAARLAMSIGSVLLVGALGAQVITTFRNPLAAYVPALKQPLTEVCALLGCRIELPTQIDYVTIEQGELQTLTETTFSFTTLLRNQGTTAQAWPHIELVLDDASDKTILRRVFSPRDYLPANTALVQGFAPHTEQSVKLYFELGQLKASGYHIAVFYP
ncbi:MAG: DUF3426 domain-containing protein [Sphingomonadaceae bacterium]